MVISLALAVVSAAVMLNEMVISVALAAVMLNEMVILGALVVALAAVMLNEMEADDCVWRWLSVVASLRRSMAALN